MIPPLRAGTNGDTARQVNVVMWKLASQRCLLPGSDGQSVVNPPFLLPSFPLLVIIIIIINNNDRYLHRGLLFQFATGDGDAGDDFKAATFGNELLGVRSYLHAHVDGLHVLLMTGTWLMVVEGAFADGGALRV